MRRSMASLAEGSAVAKAEPSGGCGLQNCALRPARTAVTVDVCSSKRAPTEALAETVEVTARLRPAVVSAQSRVVGEPGIDSGNRPTSWPPVRADCDWKLCHQAASLPR